MVWEGLDEKVLLTVRGALHKYEGVGRSANDRQGNGTVYCGLCSSTESTGRREGQVLR